MKQALIVLLVLAALVIAALVGYFYQMRRATPSYEFLRASDTYRILRDLRSGDTNAVFEALENDLDLRVIALRAILDESPRIERGKNYTNLLRRVAEYRSAHPHHNEISNVDEMVTQALNSVSKTNR
jgi:hypothetical protein